jgi:TP901 family phage tail tape measure protein
MAGVGTLGVLAVHIAAKTRQAERDVARFTQGMTRAANQIDMVGKRMRKAGGFLSLHLTTPLVGLGATAVKTFADFDLAMTRSLAIMGNVDSMMRDKMATAAREMAIEWNVSAKKAAESYFFLASAGLNAEQSLAALPTVFAFAKAGAFDMATATDLATDTQSALGMTVKDTTRNMKNMTKITDILVKANTLANATVEQFARALGSEAGSTIKNFNLDLEESVGVLAAYADQMIKGEHAGSMFGRMIRLMTKAWLDNSDAFKRFGVHVFNAEGEMNSLATIIEQMEHAFSGMSTETRGAALAMMGFQARQQQAILPLIGTSNLIREYTDGLREAGGTTEEVANKQMQAFSERMGQVWRRLQDVSMTIGQQLLPVVERMATAIEQMSILFSDLSEQQVQNRLKWAGIAAAAGPVLIVLGSGTTAIANLVRGLAKLAPFFKILGAGFGLSAGAAAAFVVIITGAILAIRGLANAMADLDEAQRQLKMTSEDLYDTEQNMLQKYGTRSTAVLAKIRNAALEGREADLEYYRKRYPEAVEAAIAGAKKFEEAKKKADEAESKAGAAGGGEGGGGDGLGPDEELMEAQARLAKRIFDARLQHMKVEDRINTLLEKHLELQRKLETAEGMDKVKLQEELLQTEQRLIEAAKEKDAEMQKADDTGPKFAGAAVAGSVEAYRAEIGPNSFDAKLRQDTEKIAANSDRTVKAVEEHLEFVRGDATEIEILG